MARIPFTQQPGASPVSNPIWSGGTHLHADDGVDEEQHGNEEAHVGQRLETHEHISSRASLRLHKPLSLAQLHPTGH